MIPPSLWKHAEDAGAEIENIVQARQALLREARRLGLDGDPRIAAALADVDKHLMGALRSLRRAEADLAREWTRAVRDPRWKHAEDAGAEINSVLSSRQAILREAKLRRLISGPPISAALADVDNHIRVISHRLHFAEIRLRKPRTGEPS